MVQKTCACGATVICNKGKAPQCPECRRAYRKARYQGNVNGTRDKALAGHTPEQAREWGLRRKYGITSEDYARMLLAQNGECLICQVKLTEPVSGKGQPSTTAVVDHDHDTDAIRGILCNGCNVGLGRFGDDPDLLERALAYLREAHLRGKTGKHA
jgi:hypothetical protein